MGACAKEVLITQVCLTTAAGIQKTLKSHTVYGVDASGATIIAGTWLTDAIDLPYAPAATDTLTVGACPLNPPNTLFVGKALTAGIPVVFTTPYSSPTGRHFVFVRYGATWGTSAGKEISVQKIDLTPTAFKLVSPINIADVDIFAESIGTLS